MTLSRAVKTSLLALLAGTIMVTEARFNQITIRDDGVIFRVRRFIADVTHLYRLVMVTSSETSSFFIRSNGRSTFFKAGSENYNLAFDQETGNILELTRNDNAGRELFAEDLDEDIGQRRLQFACEDCEEAWDIVCDITLPIICQLVRNEALGTVGAQTVDTACTQFGGLCDSLSAAEACDGSCVEDDMPTPTPTTVPPVSGPGPTPTPEPEPTLEPTPVPTDPTPDDMPTPTPTTVPPVSGPGPTPTPEPEPTLEPTPAPTDPTPEPSTPSPVESPTPSPTELPTPSPVESPPPSPQPSSTPSPTPTIGEGADACDPNPCENNGVCNVDPGGGHICDCASGFGGMSCQTDTSTLSDFYIEFEFDGDSTPELEAIFQSAADRWSEVVTHVPCGGSTDYPAGRLLITATLTEIDGPGDVLGSAGPTSIWRGCPTISATGAMTLDIDDFTATEDEGFLEDIVLHEMGHTIGIGTHWGDCSTCRDDGSADWQCPAVIEVYNDLLGDPDGTEASVIETDGGSGTECGHFDEDIFGSELMTGFISGAIILSKVTAASLEDIAYTVDPSVVDPYTLPLPQASAVSSSDEGFQMQETMVTSTVDILGDDGEVVDQVDGIMIFF